MENKNKYYKALKENRGELNEIDLGERIKIDDNETRKIIAQLLSEHKIEYVQYKTCNYQIMKSRKEKYRNQ